MLVFYSTCSANTTNPSMLSWYFSVSVRTEQNKIHDSLVSLCKATTQGSKKRQLIFDILYILIRFLIVIQMLHVCNVKASLIFAVEANLVGFHINGFSGGWLFLISLSVGHVVQVLNFAKLCVNLTLLLKATESCEWNEPARRRRRRITIVSQQSCEMFKVFQQNAKRNFFLCQILKWAVTVQLVVS